MYIGISGVTAVYVGASGITLIYKGDIQIYTSSIPQEGQLFGDFLLGESVYGSGITLYDDLEMGETIKNN